MSAKKPAFSTKIQLVALADITPYDRNPRNNDSAVRLVRASIEQFGFKVPIILDAAHVIVCGHTRYKAAQELGLDSVPCIIADDLTPAQIKAYRLADNKVGEEAEWDMDKLAEEIAGCMPEFDMAEFGFAEIGDTEPDVDEEYKQMPECENENLLENELIIHFDTVQEKIDFGKLIGQQITDKTKSIRHPKKNFDQLGTKRGLVYA